MQVKKTALNLIASLFIILFMYTSLMKIVDHEKFVIELQNSPLLKFASILSWIIPLFETGIIVLLLLPKYRYHGFLATAAIMLSFTAYVFYILNYRKDIPCSCGGLLEKMSWRQHLIVNSFFFLLSLMALTITRTSKEQ